MTQQLGKYQLIRKLATGGMAEVFLAKAAGPMGFEKTLVVKRILPHLAEDPAFVEMFLGEAKLAAQLNHPHIVQIFDFGEAEGEYFLAMEYIDGPNLRVLLKRARAAAVPLPPALCARLISAACEGLAFAHDFADPATGEPLGLIHRDISPDNILVSRQGAVKVVDFGIAKAAGQSHKTQSGVIKGKLAYMPPEQVRAKALDRRVDVYALGVVLYELLTTHKPFDSTTDASTMQAILFEPMVPAVQHRPDLPEALQRILDRALAKDREQRYPDCLTLAAELEEFILSAGKPVTAQQLVQLIAQVAPNTDAPVPTPQSGTPRGGSGPRHSATPVHTPAPSGHGTGPRSSAGPAPAPHPSMVEPLEDAKPFTAPLSMTRTQRLEAPASAEAPAASDRQGGKSSAPERPAVAPSRQRMLLPAAAGVALLVLGGGYLLWSPGAKPAHEPLVAVRAETPPAQEVAAPLKEPSQPPPAPAEPEQPPEAENPPGDSSLPEAASPPAQIAEAPQDAAATPSPAQPPPEKPSRPGKKKPLAPKAGVPAPAASKPPAATAVGKGTLAFRVRPFATVFINGKNYGQTPFDAVELPAGTYSVRFVNEELKKNLTQSVELKAGENRVIKLNLEE